MDAIYYHDSKTQAIAAEDIPQYLQKNEGMLWLDLDMNTTTDASILETVFHFHPLAIEDTLHRHQRPKVDEYENYLFLIFNPISSLDAQNVFNELDIFLGKNYIVTAHHGAEMVVATARQRLSHFHKPFEHLPTYFLYVLMDTLIDAYLPMLETIEHRIDSLSAMALDNPKRDILKNISHLKTALNEIWWVIFPQQDIISYLMQHSEYFSDEKSSYYLRDISDHLNRVLNTTQAARETINGLINIYMGAVSIRLNVAVNRLTVFTILIGVSTVIAGFYGMNFEITWPPFSDPNGVPIALAMMAGLSLLLLAFVYIQKWIE